MSTQRTAVLDVHKEGIVASMRDQFRRADTFLAELLQNGRRAGASRIDLEFEPATTVLAVADDGSGIESPDLLLLIGRSGFREIAELARENPFGIGFAAALFAAGSIRIRTRGWSADVATAELLALQPVPIGAGGFAGTRIELTLHPERVRALLGKERIDAEPLIPMIETLVAGFPVPVFVNGREIERPDALNEGYTSFPQGKLRIDFEQTTPNGPVAVYLQGLPLEIDCRHPFGYGYSRWRGQGSKGTGTVRRAVVHPDSAAFRARCPDRYAIVPDQAEAAGHAINAAIQAAWGAYLEARKAVLGGEDFALNHGDHCYEAKREALLADTPLPPAYYRRLAEPPQQLRWEDDGVHGERAEDVLPVGADVLAETVRRAADFGGRGYEEGAVSALGLYAYLSGLPVLVRPLPAGHRAAPVALEGRNARVMLHGIRQQETFSGNFGRANVMFCDHFDLAVGDDLPEMSGIDSWGLYHPDSGALILPRRCNERAIDNVLLQASDYNDESDEHRAEWLEADADRLSALHALAFGSSTAVLNHLIEEGLGALRHALAGRSFQLSFDASGKATLIPM